jgi:hypothetical protein
MPIDSHILLCAIGTIITYVINTTNVNAPRMEYIPPGLTPL